MGAVGRGVNRCPGGGPGARAVHSQRVSSAAAPLAPALDAPVAALIGGSLALSTLAGTASPDFSVWEQPAILPIAFLYILFLGSPLQEEFGWRGVLQQGIIDQAGPLRATLAVGLIWGVWHLPLIYLSGHGPIYDRPFWGLVISTVLLSFIFTWLWQKTKGSMVAMLLLHTSFNFGHYVFPVLADDNAALLLFAAELVVAMLIILSWLRARVRTA